MEILLHFYHSYSEKRKIAQIYYYDPQSAGINLHSPQSDSLTLARNCVFTTFNPKCFRKFLDPMSCLPHVLTKGKFRFFTIFVTNYSNGQGSKSNYSEEIKHCILQI